MVLAIAREVILRLPLFVFIAFFHLGEFLISYTGHLVTESDR